MTQNKKKNLINHEDFTPPDLPKHVAIIPDGNRRWARKKGFFPWQGHREGAKTLEKILQVADDLDLYCFSFWGASIDNILKRSKQEVAVLMEIFRIYFNRLANHKRIIEKQVKINILGQWQEHFPSRVKKPMKKTIEMTKDYNKYFLNFLIMYDGFDEMVKAVEKIAKKIKKEPSLKVTPELIKDNLFTRELPPVDLVIRTGVEGDPHNSAGFMMWDTAYSQLYFTNTLWPDFNRQEFLKALEDYRFRERRMGG